MASNCKRVTATGDITTHDSILRAVILTPAAAASTVQVRSGGASGTHILTLAAAAAGVSAVVDGLNVPCADGIHVTLSGASAEASVVYS